MLQRPLAALGVPPAADPSRPPQLLGVERLAASDQLREFLYSAQDPVTGGLAKWPGHGADPLHTYLGERARWCLPRRPPIISALKLGEVALSLVSPREQLSAVQ